MGNCVSVDEHRQNESCVMAAAKASRKADIILAKPQERRSLRHRAAKCEMHSSGRRPDAVATVANVKLCQYHLDILNQLIALSDNPMRTWKAA